MKEKLDNTKWNQENGAQKKWKYQQRDRNYNERTRRSCRVEVHDKWKNSLEAFNNKFDQVEEKKSVNLKTSHSLMIKSQEE